MSIFTVCKCVHLQIYDVKVGLVVAHWDLEKVPTFRISNFGVGKCTDSVVCRITLVELDSDSCDWFLAHIHDSVGINVEPDASIDN